jgi:hypothetical protein
MLEELLAGPGAHAGAVAGSPETRLAWSFPGWCRSRSSASTCAPVASRTGSLLWVLALPISYYCAHWQDSGGTERLYIYSAFSVVCALLVFMRIYLPPALAFALTFLSLWWVDVAHAFCRALECGIPLEHFYLGVGGGGARDALVLVPAMTAAMVAYATRRIRARGEALVEL